MLIWRSLGSGQLTQLLREAAAQPARPSAAPPRATTGPADTPQTQLPPPASAKSP